MKSLIALFALVLIASLAMGQQFSLGGGTVTGVSSTVLAESTVVIRALIPAGLTHGSDTLTALRTSVTLVNKLQNDSLAVHRTFINAMDKREVDSVATLRTSISLVNTLQKDTTAAIRTSLSATNTTVNGKLTASNFADSARIHGLGVKAFTAGQFVIAGAADSIYSSTSYTTTTFDAKQNKATFPVTLVIPISDESTALTASTSVAKLTFRMPWAMTVTAVRASVTVCPTGNNLLFDIHESGTTILSTKLMIDATEYTSTTAGTAYVISDASLADDAEMTLFVDQIGSTIAGAGAKITLIGTRVAP